MFNNYFSKTVPFIDVEKYFRVWQATDGNMAHSHCILDT